MKEILQEYGGFVLAVVLIGALIVVLTTGDGFVGRINENINSQFAHIAELGN